MTDERIEKLHTSVLPAETLRFLDPKPGEVFIDATLGLGGHAELILNAEKDIRLIGIDQDLAAIDFAAERLKKFESRFEIKHANFSDIAAVLKSLNLPEVDGILADLGVSSLQFDSPERGFSFRFNAPLDMRMNAEPEIETAADLLANLSEFEIARIIYEYGEERASRRIARRIVERRERGEPVKTTEDLAKLVERSVKRKKNEKIHPATKTFQALRIAVNREIEILEGFLRDSIDHLKSGGRFCVITFHSLEDRIVKQTFQKLSGKCSCPPRMPVCICGAEKKIEILTKKPVSPDEKETEENPRARSAKLRACRKI
ncbi:MAG: 16S rRNA (cytosine(1402)-N(4))-methyltransferase RsmH [Pyrinomonadaceae bacterium]|nr:16S rRNA (cytosine(1402)-N(4))-methyltransferase RsmH [Pyrinomonadaceae bacterium]